MIQKFNEGSIIFADFDPTMGHEQAGRRPAVVVSNDDYNRIMGLHIVCPISNTDRDFPTHIKLDERTRTTGSIFCEHVRTLDLSKRNPKYVEDVPEDIFDEVKEIIHSLF